MEMLLRRDRYGGRAVDRPCHLGNGASANKAENLVCSLDGWIELSSNRVSPGLFHSVLDWSSVGGVR